MEPDGLIAACATTAEERAARRAGLRTSLIGLGGVNGLPDGELISFGLAGSLNGARAGEVIDAVRVVDERGETLWEGEGLGVTGARRGTILASERVIDDPAERRRLYETTGADAVDMESGVLARTGRLRGVVRAVSDTPERTLAGVCNAVKDDGRMDWPGFLRALAKGRTRTVHAVSDARQALRALHRACDNLSQGGVPRG